MCIMNNLSLSLFAASKDCLFETKCYRRNPHHFREYSHPQLLRLAADFSPDTEPSAERLRDFEASPEVVKEQLKIFRDVCKDAIASAKSESRKRSSAPDGEEKEKSKEKKPKLSDDDGQSKPSSFIQRKLSAAEPLSLFLTKVESSPSTHRALDSLYIAELMHPSLGKIERSLQVNFMVEWDWLKMNYEVTKNEDKPLLIIHGEENADLSPSNLPSNVKAIRVKPRFPFGTHHTKLMVFAYEDQSVRVVVSTANLVGSDWQNRTQGVWVGPRCPRMKDEDLERGEKGDSRTGFKASLLRYLKFYELTPLRTFTQAIEKCDFSQVKAFFVSSVPNSHRGQQLNLWGHRQVASILRTHLPADKASWPLILQCSSIGSLGNHPDLWFKGELGQSLSASKQMSSGSNNTPISVIYPSKKDVLGSHDAILGGGCLPYSERTHFKQPWLERYLHHWRSESRDRTKAMPHIKSYTRISGDCTRAAYLLLTSANLSKAAWGTLNKARDSLQIQSYEAGVLLLPQFLTGEDSFELGKDLKLPYDLPLKEYAANDSVWFMDYLKEALRDQ